MKLVTTIARPEKLDELIDVVVDNKGRGLTVTEVRGFGRQYGELTARAAGTAVPTGLPRDLKAVLVPKVRLDILVRDEEADLMVEAVAKCARTGAIGDGKIWISAVEGAVRVRTGEQGPHAV
jgi:nitrogen regulatory protein P-II 1